VGKKLTLAPRDEKAAPDAERVNSWLEARGDVQRLDADAFLVEISSADMASQAEVYTGHDGEPLQKVRIEVEAAGIPYGSPLVTEVRKLCEELAAAFDLVVVVGSDRKPVSAFFDAGGF
jgi:hypothetical protein